MTRERWQQIRWKLDQVVPTGIKWTLCFARPPILERVINGNSYYAPGQPHYSYKLEFGEEMFVEGPQEDRLWKALRGILRWRSE